MEIHFINVVKWRRQAEKDLAGNPLHRWLDPESPPELVEEVASMDGAIAFAEDRQAFVLSDSEARELYWRRQVAEMDRRAEMAFAIETGHAEGHAEGLAEGWLEGVEEVAKNALAAGSSVEFVHKITGLDMETIAGLSADG